MFIGGLKKALSSPCFHHKRVFLEEDGEGWKEGRQKEKWRESSQMSDFFQVDLGVFYLSSLRATHPLKLNGRHDEDNLQTTVC